MKIKNWGLGLLLAFPSRAFIGEIVFSKGRLETVMESTWERRVYAATGEHVPELARLFDDYRVFYGEASSPSAALNFVRYQVSKEVTRFFVAKEPKGRLAGFVHLMPSTNTLAMRPIWLLEDLYVEPEFRRQGLAEVLVTHAEAFARQTGAERLTLSTAHNNHPAQSLYRKLGWVREDHFWYFHRLLS